MNTDFSSMEKLLEEMGFTDIQHPAWVAIKNGVYYLLYLDANNELIEIQLK
tara:strand:- start:32952 stop:33104 length:153 start_codon:yes stop_codon:yes gene_type:complete